jgi:multiple sugar transport system ATP-binding protein
VRPGYRACGIPRVVECVGVVYGGFMVAVAARGLTKRYPGGRAIDDLTFAVADGEALAVLGPSGSGKTTLLRLLAGLEQPTEGDVLFDGASVVGLEPWRRNAAVVFQGEVLYPAKDVRGNIAFPLRMRRLEDSEVDARVRAEAGAMGIARLLDRRPETLSAGHRQLVQLARAMVRAPSVFLIDEPLQTLDPPTRSRLRVELRLLQQGYGVTAIYATHDQEDALALGDRVAVIEGGALRQIGTGREVYEHPVDTFVAQFVGSPALSLLEGSARDGAVALDELVLACPAPLPDRVLVGVRAEDWRTTPVGLAGVVARFEDQGTQRFADVETAVGSVRVRVEGRMAVGSAVRLDPLRYHLFDPDTGRELFHAS